MQGGFAAWEKAGFELFSGVNVPSKAFGEHIEHVNHTPSVSPEELDALMKKRHRHGDRRQPPVRRIQPRVDPDRDQCAGRRAGAAHPRHRAEPDTLVVVNCAGRTRSIIGAQSLINAGVPNKVVALRNGTMG